MDLLIENNFYYFFINEKSVKCKTGQFIVLQKTS